MPGAQRDRWESVRPAAYTFEYRVACFCLGSQVWWTIEVHEDSVTSVALLDPADSVRLGSFSPAARHFPTIDVLFDRLQSAYAHPGASVKVQYAPFWAYPTEIAADPIPSSADDEWWALVRNFRPIN
jgi:hypothetical protein